MEGDQGSAAAPTLREMLSEPEEGTEPSTTTKVSTGQAPSHIGRSLGGTTAGVDTDREGSAGSDSQSRYGAENGPYTSRSASAVRDRPSPAPPGRNGGSTGLDGLPASTGHHPGHVRIPSSCTAGSNADLPAPAESTPAVPIAGGQNVCSTGESTCSQVAAGGEREPDNTAVAVQGLSLIHI